MPVQTADRDFFAKRGRKGPERAESSRRRVERVLWESGEAYSCYVAVSCFVALRALTLCVLYICGKRQCGDDWRSRIPFLLCSVFQVQFVYSTHAYRVEVI